MKPFQTIIAGLMSALLAAVGALLLALSGFFTVLFGMCVSRFEMDSVLNFSIYGFMLSTSLGFFVLRSVLKVGGKGLWPLTLFLATCFVCGLLYDHLVLPECIKLLGLLVVLLAVGVSSVRMIVPTKS